MGEKSIQKKQYILEKARQIFMEKGYKAVTMKDIVEACEISRGGLYLYFGSTKEIFLEVLKMENYEEDPLAAQISGDATAFDILALLFKEQKKELLRKKSSLSVAAYEFFFDNKIPKKENVLRQQFEAAVKGLEKLIARGVEDGEFYCEDPSGMARNIMYALEGLRILSYTIGVSEKMIDDELLYIMQELVIEE